LAWGLRLRTRRCTGAHAWAEETERKQRWIQRVDLGVRDELRLAALGTEEGQMAGGPRLYAG
jgi:hypothetical protein